MTLSTHPTGTIVSDEENVDVSPSEHTISAKPTRQEVLKAIMTETSCTKSQAGNALTWIIGMVESIRDKAYATHYPSEREMRGRNYYLFDTIMQHGQASTPGSAHDMVERFVLDPSREETALFHDNRDEVGSPSYCSVQVAVGVIR